MPSRKVDSRVRRRITDELISREGMTCYHCGRALVRVGRGEVPHRPEHLTLDHLKPRSQGGGEQFFNLVLACFACNQDRADRPLSDWTPPLLTA